MGDVGEGGDAEEEAASLRMDELDWVDLRKGGKVFHEEVVTGSLGVDPIVMVIKAEVGSGVIEEFPCVGEVAWINVEALGVAWFTEDGPGDSGLMCPVPVVLFSKHFL